MKNKPTNTHHIIWKALRNEFNIDKKENKIIIQVSRHNALHSLFWCLLAPKEQLRELYYIYESVLSDTSKQLFEELINMDDYDFYLEWLKKWKKQKKRW